MYASAFLLITGDAMPADRVTLRYITRVHLLPAKVCVSHPVPHSHGAWER